MTGRRAYRNMRPLPLPNCRQKQGLRCLGSLAEAEPTACLTQSDSHVGNRIATLFGADDQGVNV